LDRAAREYRQIIGPPDPLAPENLGPATGGDDAAGPDDDHPAAGSLGDAVEQALRQARDGQLEQLDADVDLQ
jgi:hypothetical protein